MGSFHFLACGLGAALFVASARAEISVQHRYRLGEDDPGATAGQVITTTRDSIGTAHLVQAGDAPAAYGTTVPPASAGSSLSVTFDGSQGLATTDGVISFVTDDFGLEAWVRPSAVSGNLCIAYNGDPAFSGWGLYLTDGTFGALHGGVVYVTGGTAAIDTWTHVAIVRASGLTTLYVNGVAVTSTPEGAATPDTGFAIGAPPAGPPDQRFQGVIDEVRFFTFEPGQFSVQDLQFNAPRLVVQQPAGSALAPGAVRDFGPVAVTTQSDLGFVLQSAGGPPLVGVEVSLLGPNAASFALLSAPSGTIATEAAFTVRFAPTSTGAKSATLRIVSNDAFSPFDVTLNGTGIPDADIAVFNGASTSAADERADNVGIFPFPNTALHTTSPAQTFTIKNAGGTPLTGLAVSVSGAQALAFSATQPGASTLDPGASTTFTATFQPAAAGAHSAVISIASNDADESPFEINVTGVSEGPEIVLEHPPGTPLLAGTVVTWGQNGLGQRNVPAGLHAVRAIAAGSNHTVARRGDGSVVAWGNSQSGITQVPAGLRANTVGAGSSHCLAVQTNGVAVGWGFNNLGQCTPPLGLNGPIAVSGGSSYSFALNANGTLTGWGANFNNILVPPPGLSGVQAIACATSHTLALKADNTVAAWGSNTGGQTNVPPGLSGVSQVSAGFLTSLALKSDGTVVSWGSNEYLQNNIPAGLNSVRAVAAGGVFSAALRSDGTVVAWGLPSGTPPAGLVGVRAIAAGDNHAVALVAPVVAFGFQTIGTPSSRTIVVRNTGTSTLNVSSVSVVGDQAAEFSAAGGTGSVPAGGQGSLTVTFTPGGAGLRTATLRVLNNDADEGEYEVALTGTGNTQTALQNWRQNNFGSPNNSGNGADNFDFDKDGLSNLLEFAFGLDPTSAASGQLPQPGWVAGKFGYRFTQPTGVTGVVYSAQWCTSLAAGDWQPISDTGAGTMHVFEMAPNGAMKTFVRLVVSAP